MPWTDDGDWHYDDRVLSASEKRGLDQILLAYEAMAGETF
ncbi:MAG: hypothetical protein QOD26_3823 [Betaproteobacteria bacterium]|jgi:hypothetical protein|nr:hypothetical protein [Betaproteobacteria bacterium]